VDPKSTFIKRFGDLVALLRFDPGNDAAQDLALTASAAAVAGEPLEVEAGAEWSSVPAESTLKSRLLARHVDRLRIAAGAEPHDLLAVARALSHDATPIPSTPAVEVQPGLAAATRLLMNTLASESRRGERRRWDERRGSGRMRWTGAERRKVTDRRTTGERRLQFISDQRATTAQHYGTLRRSLDGHTWEAALYAAFALVRITPRVPSPERRSFATRLRKTIPRRALDAFLDLAERDPVIRGPVTAVLRYVGVAAAEAIIDRLRQGDVIGVRGYYYDVLGGIPESYPLVTPLLRGREAHEARHAVALLGRIGRAEGVAELEPLIGHRDERVRTAAVRALGEIHQGPSAEPLREALHSPDPRTRSAAADAIAVWRAGALAILLVGVLESEHDRDVWHAYVAALGRIGSAEACSALATVALSRKKLLRRRGYTTWQRLAAVTALGHSDTPLARATLERVSREADGVVRYAAERLLHAGGQHAG
jgi:HEAT repeat protein